MKNVVEMYRGCKGMQDVFMEHLKEAYNKGHLVWVDEVRSNKPDMAYERDRKGKFTISGEMMRTADFSILQAIMDQVVVYHTEARYDLDQVTYYACHPSFEVAKFGEIPSEYQPLLSVKGTTEISVEWRKVG